jgi:UDP-3-O-[3-hydroxymyristoyl] glucosamine N-acyltransferase
METFNRIAPDVSLGRSVKIFGFANLHGCTVGDESRIGCFVEIQENATVGARCKISSHSFICEGVRWWPGAECDFLAARTDPLGKARWRRHEWQ